MKELLKTTFTSYWEFLALKTACKKNIFDIILSGTNTIIKISKYGNFNEKVLEDLIIALEQAGTLIFKEHEIFLTEKGEFLTEDNDHSLKYACIHWGEEHMTAWQNLDYTLRTGKQVFSEIYNKPLFEYLSDDINRVNNYHKAMNEYARDDYQNICGKFDFSIHKSILDVGGSFGALIQNISKNNPSTKCYLFEKPEVVELITEGDFTTIVGDFFKEIPSVSEAIIMSRIIHDWNDEKAKIILNNVYQALPQNGKLYLIENLSDKIEDKAALLSLNMHLITESYERSLSEYKLLLANTDFIYDEIIKINKFQYLIIANKNER